MDNNYFEDAYYNSKSYEVYTMPNLQLGGESQKVVTDAERRWRLTEDEKKEALKLRSQLSTRFGAKLEQYSVECYTAAELGRETIRLIYELTSNNMLKLRIENGYEWIEEEESIPTFIFL